MLRVTKMEYKKVHLTINFVNFDNFNHLDHPLPRYFF